MRRIFLRIRSHILEQPDPTSYIPCHLPGIGAIQSGFPGIDRSNVFDAVLLSTPDIVVDEDPLGTTKHVDEYDVSANAYWLELAASWLEYFALTNLYGEAPSVRSEEGVYEYRPGRGGGAVYPVPEPNVLVGTKGGLGGGDSTLEEYPDSLNRGLRYAAFGG